MFAFPESEVELDKEIGLGPERDDLEQASINAEKAYAHEKMKDKEYAHLGDRVTLVTESTRLT